MRQYNKDDVGGGDLQRQGGGTMTNVPMIVSPLACEVSVRLSLWFRRRRRPKLPAMPATECIVLLLLESYNYYTQPLKSTQESVQE